MALQVHIEYCTSCGFRARAGKIMEALEEEFEDRVYVTTKGGRSNAFEVTTNGQVLFSRLETGDHLSSEKAIELVRAELEGSGGGAGSGAGAAPTPAAATTTTSSSSAAAVSPAPESKKDDGPDTPVVLQMDTEEAIGKVEDFPTTSALGWSFLRWPMFWFPYNVNSNGARVVGGVNLILSIVCCVSILTEEWWGPILTILVFADFSIRFIGGPSWSFGGAVASAFVDFWPVKNRLTPGGPKQFAQLCGMMMSGAAVLTLYVDEGDDTNKIIAAVLMAGLAGAAGLESLANFCLGCWMYRMVAKLRIEALQVWMGIDSDSIAGEMEDQIAFGRRHLPAGATAAASESIVRFPNRRLPLKYKPRLAEHKKEDFHPIRHMHAMYFITTIGLGAVAASLKSAQQLPGGALLGLKRYTWIGVLYLDIVVLAGFTCLYLVKAATMWHKVRKEVDCPFRINGFAAWALSVLLVALVLADEMERVAEALFWTGAPLLMLLSITVTGRLVSRAHPRAAVNPSLMITAVGNAIAAITAVAIDDRYRQVAYLWFSASVVMWLVFFSMSLNRAALSPFTPHMLRYGTSIYFAAPAAVLLAHRALAQEGAGFSHTSLVLFYFSLFAFLGFFVAPGARAYYGRQPFSMNAWTFSFPLAALALACTSYHAVTDSAWSYFLAVATLVTSTFVALVLCVHTVAAVIRRVGIFVPDPDHGPTSFLMLTHYAFRNALDELVHLAGKPGFAAKFMQYAGVYFNHATMEDGVLFPALEAHFPGITAVADSQHHRDEADMAVMLASCRASEPEAPTPAGVPPAASSSSGGGGDGPQPVAGADLVALMQRIRDNHNSHFDEEEKHLRPVSLKLFSAKKARKLGKAAIGKLSPAAWNSYVTFTVNNLRLHSRRNMFLSSVNMATPEDMQRVGRALYETVPDLMWRRLRVDHPDMVPAHLYGHSKLY